MEVLEQEEMLWFQMSREEWIASRDRNTEYYHAVTLMRKNRNKIEALKDESGNWVSEPMLLENMVEDLKKNIYIQRGDAPESYPRSFGTP